MAVLTQAKTTTGPKEIRADRKDSMDNGQDELLQQPDATLLHRLREEACGTALRQQRTRST